MMSNNKSSESSFSKSQNLQESLTLEEDKVVEISTSLSTPTPNTVIARFPDKTCDQKVPSQEKSKKSEGDTEEEYFVFSKFLKEHPTFAWVASPEDKTYDSCECVHLSPNLPSHEKSKHSDVQDPEEEYFMFSKYLDKNPNLTWVGTPDDKTCDSPVCHQEEYFIFSQFLKQHPELSWAASPEGEEESVAATMSPRSLVLRSPEPVTPPDSGEEEEERLPASMSPSAFPVTRDSHSTFVIDLSNETFWKASPRRFMSMKVTDVLKKAERFLSAPPKVPAKRQKKLKQLIKHQEQTKTVLHGETSSSEQPIKHQEQTKPVLHGETSSSEQPIKHQEQTKTVLHGETSSSEQPIKHQEQTKPVLHGETSSSEQPVKHQEQTKTVLHGETSSSDKTDKTSFSEQEGAKRRRIGQGSQSPIASQSQLTQTWQEDTGLGDLDAKSTLFLAKQQSSKDREQQQAAVAPAVPHSPPGPLGALSGAAKMDVLRFGIRLDKELGRDAAAIGYKKPGSKKPCPCNVDKHPALWPVERIIDVHNYSFLLDCQNLEFGRETILAVNKSETIAVHDIPMNRQNPLKTKAEHVLRYIDVEVGVGDQTYHDLMYYKQPGDRRILMVVSRCRQVVGIIVAEKILQANRILHQTCGYMELEEDPVPVRVGINRLWVHVSMRRHRLATLLCQLIARCFYQDETMKLEDFAFNNVSAAMVAFAKVYLRTLRPPLYYQER